MSKSGYPPPPSWAPSRTALKSWLMEKGITQEELRRRLGIKSQTYFNELVNGKRNPSASLAMRISQETGLSLDDLYRHTQRSDT